MNANAIGSAKVPSIKMDKIDYAKSFIPGLPVLDYWHGSCEQWAAN